MADNSMSGALARLQRIFNNSVEALTQLSKAYSSDAETVSLDLTTESGATTRVTLPSLGYLRGEIRRIDANVRSLAGIDSEAALRMPDGSVRRIFAAGSGGEPPRVGQMPVPTRFRARNNWFFEEFLHPLLYVVLDVSAWVPATARRVAVKRVILEASDPAARRWFDEEVKGRSDLEYEDLLLMLGSQGATYYTDDGFVDFPAPIARFTGAFDVVAILGAVEDGSPTWRYSLSSLKYTDNLAVVRDTMALQVGDVLACGSSTFRVEEARPADSTVALRRLSGYDVVGVGSGVLRFQSALYASKDVQVNVGFDERQVVFVRTIDPETGAASVRWSPGVAFWSSEMVIETSRGAVTLADFYRDEVMDLGAQLIHGAKEKFIPAVLGEPPAAPSLAGSDFKVVAVNDHKLQGAALEELQRKAADKQALGDEIDGLRAAIQKKRELLAAQGFASTEEGMAIVREMQELADQANAKVKLYNALVRELSALNRKRPAALDGPKFRIRGFWAIPAPAASDRTDPQEVIAFEVQYRYLGTDGSVPGSRPYDFTDASGVQRRGYYSPWVRQDTPIRRKKYDPATGHYVWADEDVEDADAPNINQLDIPITEGETVEFRVRSVSEAGWPINPLVSGWSNTVTVEFPPELATADDATKIIDEATIEEVRITLVDELDAMGLAKHTADSTDAGGTYMAHGAARISSGFPDDAGHDTDLYSLLKKMQERITRLEGLLQRAKGKLRVTLVDAAGNEVPVSQGAVIDAFAGYYSEIVKQLPEAQRKGAIVTKVLYAKVSNSAAGPLELISKFPGGSDQDLPDSRMLWWRGMPYPDMDYVFARRYELVPVSFGGVSARSALTGGRVQPAPYQSGQLPSQVAYSRYTDVGLKSALYKDPAGAMPRYVVPFRPTSAGALDFVWNGRYVNGAPQGKGRVTEFSFHTSHPLLQRGSIDYEALIMPDPSPTSAPVSLVRHAQYFDLQASDADGQLQLEYRRPTDTYSTSATVGTRGALDQMPDKLGFSPEDRYLIGRRTCGSYLFMAPSSIYQLQTDSPDFTGKREVEFGDDNAILIPIVFQFRMTDFYGPGATGTGVVGGWRASSGAVEAATVDGGPQQVTYTKRIGIDVHVKDEPVFSFDVRVTAKYRRDAAGQAYPNLTAGNISVRRDIVTAGGATSAALGAQNTAQ